MSHFTLISLFPDHICTFSILIVTFPLPIASPTFNYSFLSQFQAHLNHHVDINYKANRNSSPTPPNRYQPLHQYHSPRPKIMQHPLRILRIPFSVLGKNN